MKNVDLYGRVRHAVLIDGMSSREAARVFGVDPRTIAKMLAFSACVGVLFTDAFSCFVHQQAIENIGCFADRGGDGLDCSRPCSPRIAEW